VWLRSSFATSAFGVRRSHHANYSWLFIMIHFDPPLCSSLLQLEPLNKSLYVKVTPNYVGRFGHQFHNIITGILLAQVLGGRCLRPSFTGNSECWNRFLVFGGRYVCDHRADLKFKILNGAFGKYVTMQSLKLYYNYSLSYGSQPLLISLQPDQFAGLLVKLLPRSVHELRKGLLFNPHANVLPEIALHVRRGDVSPTNASSLFTSFDTYLVALEMASDKLPSDWPVTIYSQGRILDFEYLALRIERHLGRQVSFCLEPNIFSIDASLDFFRMISSGAFICSYSTYAYCALYFSSDIGMRFFIADSRSDTIDGMLHLNVLRSIGVEILGL